MRTLTESFFSPGQTGKTQTIQWGHVSPEVELGKHVPPSFQGPEVDGRTQFLAVHWSGSCRFLLLESGRHGHVLHTYGAEDACALWDVGLLTFTEVFIKTGKRKERPLKEMSMAVLRDATIGEMSHPFPYILMFKSTALIVPPLRGHTRYEYQESGTIRTTLKSVHY